MEVKMLIVLCVATCASCAKIIPLSYWQEPEAAATTADAVRERESNSRYYVGRFEQASPEYYSYSANAAAARRRDDFIPSPEVRGRQDTEITQTQVQAFDADLNQEQDQDQDHQREARRLRQDPTTMKPRKKNKDSLMSRILPMLVMPFLVSSTLIPMMLTTLKFMLLKSLFVGKIAIVLLAINALWKSDNRGGVYSHNVSHDYQHEQKDLHQNHYGYNGDEEYGAYVNRRSARVTRFR